MRFSNYSSRNLHTGKRERRHLLCRGFAAFRLWSSGLLNHYCGNCLPKSRRDCYRHVKVRGEYAACTFLRSKWGRDFLTVQTDPGAHPAPCKLCTESFPGVKCGRGVLLHHSPPSSAAVMEEYSYISNHPLGHTGSVTGSLYHFNFTFLRNLVVYLYTS